MLIMLHYLLLFSRNNAFMLFDTAIFDMFDGSMLMYSSRFQIDVMLSNF